MQAPAELARISLPSCACPILKHDIIQRAGTRERARRGARGDVAERIGLIR